VTSTIRLGALLVSAALLAGQAHAQGTVEQATFDLPAVRDPQLGAQIAIADHFGYFKDEGLTVTVKWQQSGGDIITLMASGQQGVAGGGSFAQIVLGGQKLPVDGREVTRAGADRGVVFQEYALFPWRTAIENVEFGPMIQGRPKPERRATARRYLSLVGLAEHEDKFPRELSGGMKQRVAIARVLANHPSVLLMDEPFGALDAQTREVMQEELLRIWEQDKKTVVFVTHSISESIFLADRIVIMATRPGTIKEIVDVTMPHPRDRSSAPFVALEREIKRLVREEVAKLGVT